MGKDFLAILHENFRGGKTFTVFQPIMKVFPSNHLLCTVHDGHSQIYHESFPVYSVFCESFAVYDIKSLLSKVYRNYYSY